jgi:hypothetical protein
VLVKVQRGWVESRRSRYRVTRSCQPEVYATILILPKQPVPAKAGSRLLGAELSEEGGRLRPVQHVVGEGGGRGGGVQAGYSLEGEKLLPRPRPRELKEGDGEAETGPC